MPSEDFIGRTGRTAFPLLAVVLLLAGTSLLQAQTAELPAMESGLQPVPLPAQQTDLVSAVFVAGLPDAPSALPAPQTSEPAVPQSSGSIAGLVKDSSGALVIDAEITLTPGGRVATPSADGRFRFTSVPAGAYTLTVAAPDLASVVIHGVLQAGEAAESAEIVLRPIAADQVDVVATPTEIAAAQVKLEEKQRVIGIFPNFYATYIWHAQPLSTKQKFSLAWRNAIDPVSFLSTGFFAGIEQAQNTFSGYGQGAQGYAKRFGAGYSDDFISGFLAGAVLPSLLRQDPRYFYKGTGTIRARTLYAISTVVICRGDNGHWQPNYSNVLGNLATAGISNLYYPASDRHGAGLTIDNSLLGIAEGAFGSIFQEFVVKHLTPRLPDYRNGKPLPNQP